MEGMICPRCSGFVLAPEELKLILIIRDVGWGQIQAIEIRDSQPRVVRLNIRKDIKLEGSTWRLNHKDNVDVGA